MSCSSDRRSSYFSALYIDAANRLAVVAPEIGVEDLSPLCPCCTYTFNGRRFVRPYEEGVPFIRRAGT